jgi:pimeloyl-ACP methyl ester carboxylesterase
MPNSRVVRRRWTRWLWIVPLSSVALLLVLAGAGFTYEKIAEARDRERFPPPGVLVDVGGFKLHLYCTGQGSPTVVLDTGAGVVSRSWAPVQSAVESTVRVCSYDRGGYGWSDPSPAPRTSATIAQELRTLLRNAGERPPFILVGHSLGGFNSRVFTHEYLDEVAGLILVDSSHEDQMARQPPEMSAAQDGSRVLYPLIRIAARVGLLRLAAVLGAGGNAGPSAELARASLPPHLVDAVMEEAALFEVSAADARKARPLGDLPLIVLTAGAEEANLPEQLREPVRRYREIWVNELQPDLARMSSRSRHVVIEDSGHMIPLVRPDAVSDAILDMARETNGSR